MKRLICTGIASLALLAATAAGASADSIKTCTTVEPGKNKNWTVTTVEEQRAACPSADSASNPVDQVVAEDVANNGGNLPPGQQP